MHKNTMEINNILTIEIEGLCKTIIHYTNDEFVRSYAEQLLELEFPKDTDRIKLLIDRLFDWYEDEIDRIVKSEYIHNKKTHLKSYNLITEAKELLAESGTVSMMH